MFEPIQSGPKQGYKVEKDKFRVAIGKYFEIMNWDEQAVPRPMKLAELDLGWVEPMVAPYRGKLGDVIGA